MAAPEPAELRARFDDALNDWRDIREEARADMRYVAGDPWEPKDRLARKNASRPCLALDELGQYFNQTINDLRLNPRGMQFAPVGNGANDKGARFYEEKAREIEYRSHAQIAYITAAENMIQRSYGWVRVDIRYANLRSSDKDLWIEAIPNPDMVLPDPNAKRPDFSDMKDLFFFEMWVQDDFKRKFGGKAKAVDFSSIEFQKIAPNWVKPRQIQLAEYWRIEERPRELLRIQLANHPQPWLLFRDELESGLQDGSLPAEALRNAQITVERTVDWPDVKQYLTNGLEILEETDWPGRYIPFVAALGKVLYVDDGGGAKRRILSMTRLARDPFMAYCFYRTCEIENVGMTTKNPYWAYRGQLSQKELKAIAASMHEPTAVLEADWKTPDSPSGQVLPLPQRTMLEAQLQSLSLGAEEMRRAIQAAMGISPMPTIAQKTNQKSGIALKQIEGAEQKGSYHFVDHYEDLIRQVGVIIEDLIPHVYAGERETGVRQADGSAQVMPINGQGQVSVVGDYQVTVSAGPAQASQREAADDFVDALVSNLGVVAQTAGPQVAAAVLAQSIRLKNLGPLGDQIADYIEPPQFKTKDGQPPDPQVMGLQQQLQQAEQQLQQLKQALDGRMAEAQATKQMDLQIAQFKAQADQSLQITLKQMDIAGKIEVARITAAKQAADLAAEAAEERLALGAKLAHDGEQRGFDRRHEIALAAAQAGTQAALQAADAATVPQPDEGSQS